MEVNNTGSTGGEAPVDFAQLAVTSPLTRAPAHPAGFFVDLEQFKADLTAAGLDGAEEQIATVAVRKPPAEEYVRVHPGKDMTIALALHESRDNFASSYYIVMPKLLGTLMDLRGAFFAQLYVTVTRSGAVTLWPVKLPTGGAGNPWYESAIMGSHMAKTDWIRIFADAGQKQYRIMKALGEFEAPKFPEKPLNELLEIAFKGRIIDSVDHPICRKLRGEV